LLIAQSLNLRRRHLTADQIAAIDLRIQRDHPELQAKRKAIADEARARQRGALKQGPQMPRRGPETPTGTPGRTAAQVARDIGSTETAVKRVDRVAREHPDAMPAIAAGEVTAQEVLRQGGKEKTRIKRITQQWQWTAVPWYSISWLNDLHRLIDLFEKISKTMDAATRQMIGRDLSRLKMLVQIVGELTEKYREWLRAESLDDTRAIVQSSASFVRRERHPATGQGSRPERQPAPLDPAVRRQYEDAWRRRLRQGEATTSRPAHEGERVRPVDDEAAPTRPEAPDRTRPPRRGRRKKPRPMYVRVPLPGWDEASKSTS
jgi:hypothetical protein